jgi:HAD superfamily phosphatase (TIGR01668 family)
VGVNRGEKQVFEILKPKIYVNSIYNLDLKKLKKLKNIKSIIVDLDNTLIAWGNNEIDNKVINWIKEAKKLEIKICIVSNSNSNRVKKIAKILNLPYYSKFFKPLGITFINALKIMNTNYLDTVVIGDQIFTDIWGGNRLKLFTILVTPIIKRDSIGTFFQRTLEKIIISFWFKRDEIKKEIGNWPK